MRLTAFVPASAKTPWSGGLPSKARRNADRHSHERLACPISEFRNLVLTDRRCQGLRSSSGSFAILAAIRRASSRVVSSRCANGCENGRFPPWDEAQNSYAEIRLQSCETLPEGWPCLSTDSAQIGAVKVS